LFILTQILHDILPALEVVARCMSSAIRTAK